VLRDPAEHPMFIQTVRGVGYRFIAPVRRLGEDATSTAVTPQLARWISDDETAIAFSILWLATSIPLTLLFTSARFVPLLLVPPALRLLYRANTIRTLLRGGVSPRAMAEAIRWADGQPPATPVRRGWRRWLYRARNAAFAVCAVAALPFALAPVWKFWEWHWVPGVVWQVAWDGALWAGAAGLILMLADGLSTPHAPFDRATERAQRAWRGLVARWIGTHTAAPSPFLLDAEREVEEWLRTPWHVRR
jgi:hypothetical protein